ncbi:MAG: acetyl-CoA carboxylase biotin carboxylase subunit, partial [Chloroflexota bacterium]|nr:acetyl-CoA carboxylase biotin carboxylase subunit [Chloroflexota bacterium]
RLQVEHPVTELVTGIDLVLEQFRIASGRPLRISQGDVTLSGHAIECRIAAEDPFNNFAPSLGDITSVSEPSGPGVRVDSGIYRGGRVSIYYDPMMAKLIVWAPTRAHAILRMRRALEEYRIVGVQTNIPFHLGVTYSVDFQRGKLDTAFVERFLGKTGRASHEDSEEPEHIAAVTGAMIAERRTLSGSAVRAGNKEDSGHAQGSNWRLSGRKAGMR